MKTLNGKTFKETKQLFKQTIQNILKDNSSYEIDEAALPAYAHNNPLIDYVFWRRVELAYDIASQTRDGRVLDFGCGSGLLSYALAQQNISVVANDTTFAPLPIVRSHIAFPDNVEYWEGNLLNRQIPDGYFDFIIALDVLEHIDNIDEYITVFKRILKPGGIIIVSGPTENIIYKIGRRLAGEKFTGDYHVTDIKAIRKLFEKRTRTTVIRKLMWPFVLFELFVAQAD
jgi:2-polyprenyl-3-methyl-5-hydroxy-6-metoxy-1,4-benzoquinol methylase